ncbi:hypothetical protein KR009_004560 [Drosophila setifemur]|nr:hypothetical protein KR009_004560 [Drosophila setifemur]
MFVVKILILLTACVLASAVPQGLGAVGAPRELQGEELVNAQKDLESSLLKLAAGSGPNYRISKVYRATYQVVSGSSTKFSVELIDNEGATKTCDVDIWNQSWLPDGIQVTFRCPNQPEIVRVHS